MRSSRASAGARGSDRRAAGQTRAARILITSGSAELYGSDRVMQETARALVEGGATVMVVAGAPGPLLKSLRALGASTVVQESPVLRRSYLSASGLLRGAFVVFRTAPRMVALVSRLRPDVVYVNTMTMPAWTLVARLAGVRAIVHVHEAEARQPAALRRLLAASLRLATTVVFNGETARALAIADCMGRLPATIVVPNPVPGPTCGDLPRARLDGPTHLLYIGRISERKGVDVALEAVAELSRRGVDATLDLVGDVFPGYEDFLRRVQLRASLPDLRGRVRFHGFQTDVGPYLREADIVLVPSRSDESFGNVLIEAVSAGRPVVAAAQAGLREAAEGLSSVVFVAPGDRSAIADAVEAIATSWPLVRNSVARDSGIAARRHDPRTYRRLIREVVNGQLSRG